MMTVGEDCIHGMVEAWCHLCTRKRSAEPYETMRSRDREDDRTRSTIGVIRARFDGRCSRCEEGIEAGSDIAPDVEGGWYHWPDCQLWSE